VNRGLRALLYLTIICCVALGLSQTALATETSRANGADIFRTTGNVNFRTGPSTDASVIRTVSPGTNVEVLEHDPGCWSLVRINGSVGYMNSEFLVFPIGDTPANFITTDGVNFRTGPSTATSIITTFIPGTKVDVLEHNPASWSKVSVDGAVGYIRSDFLARPIHIAPETDEAPVSTSPPLRTVGRVNFRTGPSTNASIIRTLEAGVSVDVLEKLSNGWSKASVNGTVGYIMSNLISIGGGGVELLEWTTARNLVRNGVPMRVTDVRTGTTFTIQSFSKSGHADVEPLTQADTDAILRTRNGVWSWSARPVWVTIGDRTIAAALNGMPHAGSTIRTNGMDGHLCLHFNGTVTNNKSYQRDLNNAVMEAWNAAQR
jgi:uncharacterized protein YgiM (DUF1202 family)